MENSVMVLKKKGNQKGFSLVELLIVIAIMGVLAVIAFNAFNGVLTNSKRKADDQQAKNIEKALKLLATDTGVIDFTSTKLCSTYTAGATTGTRLAGIAQTPAGVEKLIEALQAPIYVFDNSTNIFRAYGPYLDNPNGGVATYASFQPQWTTDTGGAYTGYFILVTKATNQIVVSTVGTVDEKGVPVGPTAASGTVTGVLKTYEPKLHIQ